jgi:hypothetical protein
MLWATALVLFGGSWGPVLASAQTPCEGEAAIQGYTFDTLIPFDPTAGGDSADLSERGEAAFFARLVGGETCLMHASRDFAETETVLCDVDGDPFGLTGLSGRPSINSNGAIAFSAVAAGGNGRVFVVERNPQGDYSISTAADAVQPCSCSAPVLNDAGQVAFIGTQFPSFNPALERSDPGAPPVRSVLSAVGNNGDFSSFGPFSMDSGGSATLTGSLAGGQVGAARIDLPFQMSPGEDTPSVAIQAFGDGEFPDVVSTTGSILTRDSQDRLLYRSSALAAPLTVVDIDLGTGGPEIFVGPAAIQGCRVAFTGFSPGGVCRGGSRNGESCEEGCPGTGICNLQCGVCFVDGSPCESSDDCSQPAFCQTNVDALFLAQPDAATSVVKAVIVQGDLVSVDGSSECVIANVGNLLDVNSAGDLVLFAAGSAVRANATVPEPSALYLQLAAVGVLALIVRQRSPRARPQ